MFRSRSEDAPTTSFRDVIPVLPRFESEEGELKAILSSRLAMTASTIAMQLLLSRGPAGEVPRRTNLVCDVRLVVASSCYGVAGGAMLNDASHEP